jgi:hypothetical protein
VRRVLFFISLAILGLGLYLHFFYDVPDSQTQTNFFVSWFLIIVGAASILMNLLWSSPRKGSTE